MQKGINFIWEAPDTRELEQRKFGIRTVLSTQLLQDYPPAVLKSANTLWLLRYRPDEIPFLRDNFGVPEVTLRRFLKMPEGGCTGWQRCPGTGCVPCKKTVRWPGS